VDASRFRNASGAGDCAAAGLLSAMLRGITIERAALYAMCAGRDNLYGADANSGLSDWRTMTAYVNALIKNGALSWADSKAIACTASVRAKRKY